MAPLRCGWTWALQLCALPLDGQLLLVDRCTVTLPPSIRTHALLATRPIGSVDGGALSYRDDDAGRTAVRTELIALVDYPGGTIRSPMSLTSVDSSPRRGAEYSLAAIAADVNRAPGLAQAVVDHRHVVVVAAADFLRPTAHPPALLSFGVCHGMYPPNHYQYEPLGLAVCALSAGAQAVIAAHFELDDAGGTAASVLRGLYRATAHGISPPRRWLHSSATMAGGVCRCPAGRCWPYWGPPCQSSPPLGTCGDGGRRGRAKLTSSTA
jgi:hypothetical protein